MPPKRDVRYTSDDVLAERVSRLEEQVKALIGNKVLTSPVYDSSNFPAEAVEGQFALGAVTGSPDPDYSGWAFVDGQWRQVGGPSAGGGATPELFEIASCSHFGSNVLNTSVESSDYLEWNQGFFSYSYDGIASPNGWNMDQDVNDTEYFMWPNPTNFGMWKFEFMMFVGRDPQTEPITTPKLWNIQPIIYVGSSGSWAFHNNVTPDNSSQNKMVVQWNAQNYVAVPNSQSDDEVIWATWYSQVSSGSPYAALRVFVHQTHPTGVSADDRQTTIFAECKITQVRIPTFPYQP